ncbi:hypothetical protein QTP81_14380 [Alteromonas sp. ASW11-36]|uniref:Secreted protein n=1 Tax=Alteromonas arenosi TaxID=3055817 RepID=A0ABT7T013_9ALTE|nr:hypothetical protein [Alteromonas sp. ASW11-36]MDM7861786.1 hypothetical protein [Alteromonas sp. ASW11-36]
MRKQLLRIGLCLSFLYTFQSHANVTPADQFFANLSKLCGKAYAGTISIDTPATGAFADQALVMHVRECTDTTIKIPFHVGDDRSRTWVIEKTLTGLSLKHDHRHRDGSEDDLTQYGGVVTAAGWPTVQSFPADRFTVELFIEQAIPQSIDNTWQLFLYPEVFTYRLIRPAREFRVDFDLTNPIEAPPAPWGFED